MEVASKEITHRVAAARSMAVTAGKSTLPLFQSERLQVDFKRDRSPVTAADRNAEQVLRDSILQDFPHDSVLGEELGEVSGTSEFRWVLDPIDGTKSFISGVPLYGTMVGLECAGDAVGGVIYFPALDELVYASRGGGAWSTKQQSPPRQIHVSHKTSLSDCTLLITESKTFAARNAQDSLLQLERATFLTRTWGDCYGYYLVATGRADIMIDPVLHLWDAVAAKPIITEAGGVFCDWRGRPRTDSGDAVAANGAIMSEVLKILDTSTVGNKS